MAAPHLTPRFAPEPNPEAVVWTPNLRITVLTARLLRIEYNPTSLFEDRPSQVFWYRMQPVPDFEVNRSGSRLEVSTSHLHVTYQTGKPLHANTLQILLKESKVTWRYGDKNQGDLKGTYRTLDTIDGRVPLEPGLLSRAGWVVVDDSKTLVFNEGGWLEPRGAPEGTQDLYFFGYGRAFQECLRDYRKVAGDVPLIPRWALGNWWSRYWDYTHNELCQLIEDFQQHEIPLSVCIIDMDWHITDTGNTCSGWTGYTWNRELFPDPDATIATIHRAGLKTALNLHPAEGIHPHEAQYEAFCKELGVDPTTGEPVPFNLADPAFTRQYFELLHHPEEERGVDFWWIDWQQGTLSGMPGLDPLWWLNHLHFYDLGRDGRKRPFIFSRWGGLGNHRYPIGFSGDTIITWDSLAFQPFFTATAANIGYGWWSHDIGGHFGGIEEPELYTRWVQYGLLSPILRLHSTKNPMLERRPFAYDAETLRITREAMQLRHAFIPYLYTMAWRDHAKGIVPVRPMYHDHPEEGAAYHCPDQYAFGSELVAAPFVRPMDQETRLSRSLVWLPEGGWGFFSGTYYPAGHHAVYGNLEDIPLFVTPGAIVPLGSLTGWGGIENPNQLTIHIFPGADNHFELYEDDGETNAYQRGNFTLTPFDLKWEVSAGMTFTIGPARGDLALVPGEREYVLKLRGVAAPHSVEGSLNGEPVSIFPQYEPEAQTITVPGVCLTPEDTLVIQVEAQPLRPDHRLGTCQKMARAFRMNNSGKQVLYLNLPEILEDPERLAAFRPALTTAQMRALLEVITGAGLHHFAHTGVETLVLWNNAQNPDARYQFAVEHFKRWLHKKRFSLEEGVVPEFKAFLPGQLMEDDRWSLDFQYGRLLTLTAP